MGSSAKIMSTHPQLDFTIIIQRGLKALNLALVYAVQLGPRLSKDLVPALESDLTLLGAAVPGAKQAHDEAQGATASQETALSRGYEKVRAVRAALRKGRAASDTRKAYGVGQALNPRIVRDVVAALNQITDRAVAMPAEAAEIGIIPADIDAMKALVAAITEADRNQGEKLAKAPRTTQERNLTANRILAAVGRIEGAGLLQFADDTTVRASFEALSAGPKKGKKSTPTPAGDDTPKPAPDNG